MCAAALLDQPASRDLLGAAAGLKVNKLAAMTLCKCCSDFPS